MALAKYYEDIIDRKIESTKKAFSNSSVNNKIKQVILGEALNELELLKSIIIKEISDFIDLRNDDELSLKYLKAKNELRDKEIEIISLLQQKEKSKEYILKLAEECDQLESNLNEANQKITNLEKRKKVLKNKLKK